MEAFKNYNYFENYSHVFKTKHKFNNIWKNAYIVLTEYESNQWFGLIINKKWSHIITDKNAYIQKCIVACLISVVIKCFQSEFKTRL